jgi:DNA-binding LytR/AlgR family response regulator
VVKIAIVDDEEIEREQLKSFFNKLSKVISEELDIVTYESGEALLEEYDQSLDLICLDIQMQGRDGIDIAKQIRVMDSQVILIFVTNMAQMAIEGYSVRALDFIIKPVHYSAFLLKMQNIVKNVANKKSKNIVINAMSGFIKISTNDLYYVEVEGHYISYHTNKGLYRQKASLKELEDNLKDLSFKRCNNCYLVNLKYVNAVRKDETLVGVDWLKISRPKKKEFLQALTNYMGGVTI